MLKRIYLTKVTVAKQHIWSFTYTQTCTEVIYKITVES